MNLSRYLTTKNVDIGQKQIFLKINPGTQFGFLGTADGSVERVKGTPQVLVPAYDWQATGVNEEETAVRVLTQAAEANPLKMPSASQMDRNFWAKLRGMRALLLNPGTIGTFRIPLGVDILKSEFVAKNRLVVLGPPDMVGYYVKQGARRNVLAHNKLGMTAIQFYAAA